MFSFTMHLLWPCTKCFVFFFSAPITKGNMIITSFLGEFCSLERCLLGDSLVGWFSGGLLFVWLVFFFFQFCLLMEARPMGRTSLYVHILPSWTRWPISADFYRYQSQICAVRTCSVSDKGCIRFRLLCMYKLTDISQALYFWDVIWRVNLCHVLHCRSVHV